MRPTFLQFRSPKERTPDPYDVQVTCEGVSLDYRKSKSPMFGRERRFRQYDQEARKTGFRIGPGSYSKMDNKRVKGGHRYMPLHGLRGDPKESYYVGQLLVRSPQSDYQLQDRDLPKNRKTEFTRPTTASDLLTLAGCKPFYHRKPSPVQRTNSHSRISPKLD